METRAKGPKEGTGLGTREGQKDKQGQDKKTARKRSGGVGKKKTNKKQRRANEDTLCDW